MHLFFNAVSTILSLAILQSFNWAIRRHFKSERIPTGMKLIMAASTITLLAYLALLWIGASPVSAQLAGMALEVCGFGLFAASVAATRQLRFKLAFDEETPDHLMMSGPYRYVRHPFYTSYLIFWSGFALITFSWLSLPLLLMMAAIYYTAAAGEDRKLACSALADQHAVYREKTGMFWPKLLRK
jgi:protein-S-isoprenylcysteine O-methyltransferase Ste14